MMNHLSFLTERGICEFADSEEPVHEIVRVILLVDGVPYVQDWKEFPCEPLEIIALGARSGEIFPFNCKCGFRHCGGFEFPVVVSVNGDEISWTVPSAPFDKISSDGDGRPKARALRFQVEQYKDACDGLLKTLFLEEEKLGQLFTGASQRCKYSLAKQISIEKNSIELGELQRRIFGELALSNFQLNVNSPSGLTWKINLRHVISKIIWNKRKLDLFDLEAIEVDFLEVLACLQKRPNNILSLLPFDAWSTMLRIPVPERLSGSRPVEAFQPEWEDGEEGEEGEEDGEDLDPLNPYWGANKESPQYQIDFWLDLLAKSDASLVLEEPVITPRAAIPKN